MIRFRLTWQTSGPSSRGGTWRKVEHKMFAGVDRAEVRRQAIRYADRLWALGVPAWLTVVEVEEAGR